MWPLRHPLFLSRSLGRASTSGTSRSIPFPRRWACSRSREWASPGQRGRAARHVSSHTSRSGVRSSRLGRRFGTALVAGASSQHGPRPREGSRTTWRSKAGAIVRAGVRSGRRPPHVNRFGHQGGRCSGHLHRAVFSLAFGFNRHGRANRHDARRTLSPVYVSQTIGSYVFNVTATPSVRVASPLLHSRPQAQPAHAPVLRGTSYRFAASRVHGTPQAAPPNPACSGLASLAADASVRQQSP